ncbi:hypothetical protein AAKU55_002809 [Oxalobacteraceae bacterium GrIS 1.11]
MNKIKMQVEQLIASGTSKSQVFAQLSGPDVKDRKLAYFIASHVDPRLCERHATANWFVIGVVLIQALILLVLTAMMGAEIGPTAQWLVPAIALLLPLMMVWGFYKHNVGAYNVYIALSFIGLPQSLKAVAATPLEGSIALVITIACFALVWYVRAKLFPDFAFMGPKKVNGRYIFSD